VKDWVSTRAVLANAIKLGYPPAQVTELRLRFRAERLADRITDEMLAEPPLTAAQRLQLATLLTGGSDA